MTANGRLSKADFRGYLVNREILAGQEFHYGEPAEIAERFEVYAKFFLVHYNTIFLTFMYEYMRISLNVKEKLLGLARNLSM